MWKQLSLVGAALAMGVGAFVPAAPAMAQRYHGDHHDRYRGPAWRGHDRYSRDAYRRRDYRRCRDNGDGGTIIGAIAGGLLGNQVAGRGDRTLGAVLGAGAGALAGRAIDRSDRPGYCR